MAALALLTFATLAAAMPHGAAPGHPHFIEPDRSQEDLLGAFQHPGVVVSGARITAIKQLIANKTEPIFSAYLKALASPSALISYVPQGPPADGVITCGSYDHPDIGCSKEDFDGDAAALQSLLYVLNGTRAYALNTIKILNAYAQGFKKYNNSNAPLQAGWSLDKWSRAAELIKHSDAGWSAQEALAFEEMLYRTHLPLIYPGSPANGNWELSMIEGMFGLAVLSENATLFAHATSLWRQRIPAYIYITSDGPKPVPPPRGTPTWYNQSVFNASVNGISQETCRDLGHTQMGLASAINAAETAYVQGVDLFSEMRTRFAATLEFHSRLLLPGARIPEYICHGNVTLAVAPTFEIGYNAINNRLQMPLPTTLQHLLVTVRPLPDPLDRFMMIYETLTHGAKMPARAGEEPPRLPPQMVPRAPHQVESNRMLQQ
eukprot:m.33017 g.33017  ORF g.33017 m.33017 type:complete len:433 (+) comp5061_c0_seq2:3-1301(+)